MYKIDKTFPLVELAALIAGALLVACYMAAGHFTRHMLIHIGLMTVLAPLLASFAQRWGRLPLAPPPGFLLCVTLLQLLLFFYWHSPAGVGVMHGSLSGSLLMQGSLLLVAFGFWLAVFRGALVQPWGSVLALLLTGKLFCLVALIMVFAPRVLYPAMTGHAHGIFLADQQLAGLLMITICPITYVLSAILLVVRWLRLLEDVPACG